MLNLTPAVIVRIPSALPRSECARLLTGIRRFLDCVAHLLGKFSRTSDNAQAHLEGFASYALARRLRRRSTPPRDR
jgi:hypothetical protein